MPQLILEFSSNIVEKNNLANLFQEFHSILEKILPTDIDSCKSRSMECHNYYIGNGDPNNAFVHISLKIMPGRNLDTLKNVGDSMMAILKIYFASSLKELNLQITLEVMELQKTYFKITN
jgi:5-carboxymethyl-2-hydroxymuconate isomerase